jgi:hypothetical protein
MPENGFQATLFELPADSPTHLFYVVTDMYRYKSGHTENIIQRMKDRQFNGTLFVSALPCNCERPGEGKNRKCVQEMRWEHTHRRARLPRGEWYTPTAGIEAALRLMFGPDARAMAIVDAVARNHRKAAG